jgi:hypothetical protein
MVDRYNLTAQMNHAVNSHGALVMCINRIRPARWGCTYREVPWGILQLLLERINVVGVDVRVPHHVHKLTRPQATDLMGIHQGHSS